MPAPSNVALTYDFCVHTTAADFLEATEYALVDQERRSNLILAHALERLAWEASHTGLGTSAATVGLTPHARSMAWWERRRSKDHSTVEVCRDFWLTSWTVQTPVASTSRSPAIASVTLRLPTLDFAISVLVSDPVFVFTPHSAASLGPNFLIPRAVPLVRQLVQYMPVERMSRIFALYPVAEIIADAWTAQTGVARAPESQCNVFSTFCTVATFSGVQPLPEGHRAGLARATQVSQLASIYHEFEKELVSSFTSISVAFVAHSRAPNHQIIHPISHDCARQKVERMIQQEQLWVYESPVLDETMTRMVSYEVRAIAALTRHTTTVAALSTIYTLPQARGQRIAERLVGRICSQ
jgi:hypothetical protein